MAAAARPGAGTGAGPGAVRQCGVWNTPAFVASGEVDADKFSTHTSPHSHGLERNTKSEWSNEVSSNRQLSNRASVNSVC